LKSGLPALSAESADRICRALLPLAEDAWTLSGRLSALGFAAHLPWQQFFESFAEGEAELEEYRRYRVESAKNVIGRPWPRSMFEREAPYFFSEQVKTLLEQRDRDNGVDESELSKRYPTGESLWRRELTRCDRRRVQMEMQRRDEYQQLRTRAEEASRQVLLTEVERAGPSGGLESSDPVECYAQAMALHAARLGFQRDAAKSKGTVPVFSRELAGIWDLCWAIEQPQFRAPGWRLFSPALQLRSRSLAGSTDRAPKDSYLTLRFEQVVPEFNRGYMSFTDCASLQTLVRAHLALYELMAPVLEGGIRRHLLH
jgi:hypothetical protein